MNWFERYGIVGMFFWLMTILWLAVYFPEVKYYVWGPNRIEADLIVGFCSLTFLPIGYLINIVTQNYYYCTKGVHCCHWRNLNPKLREKLELVDKSSFGEIKTNDEATVEAVLTFYDRTSLDEFSVEENKFLSGYATKRYFVIAINNSMILAILLAVVCAALVALILIADGSHLVLLSPNKSQLNISSLELFDDNVAKHIWSRVAMMYIFSSIIIFVLFKSCEIMEKQIVEIGKRKLSKLKP